MLTEQLIGVLQGAGIEFGVRAAEFGEFYSPEKRTQVSSIPTELSRVYERKVWELHESSLVIVDEAHTQTGAGSIKVLEDHCGQESSIVGVTATPLGCNWYSQLVVAGSNSELRRCGAHVPCRVFACEELDTSKIRPQKTGEFSVNDIVKEVWSPAIVGHVVKHIRRLNPDLRPMLLYAPAVAQSVWCAEELARNGISAAHIDGDDVVVCLVDEPGSFTRQEYKSDRTARAAVLDMSAAGEIKAICNRFVLREAIDMPWIYHEILATPIGSLSSYIQTVGRVLRSHPSMDHCLIQDHGGNYWRHGSPNADRKWDDIWRKDERMIQGERSERLREKEDFEPIRCPTCGMVRASGPVCPSCGSKTEKRSRVIIQHNGELREIRGDVYKPRKKAAETSETQRMWDQCFYRCQKSGRTFNQARALFYRETGAYPPDTLKRMPKNGIDWYLKVKDVSYADLS